MVEFYYTIVAAKFEQIFALPFLVLLYYLTKVYCVMYVWADGGYMYVMYMFW